jgi:hypothetical protein
MKFYGKIKKLLTTSQNAQTLGGEYVEYGQLFFYGSTLFIVKKIDFICLDTKVESGE